MRIAGVSLALALLAAPAVAAPPPVVHIATGFDYPTLLHRLETAIADHRMNLVARASASQGAEARGIAIPGNAVLMVFRNDFAVRMLAASLPSGIEAPIRLYVTEGADHRASLDYRTPGTVFAPYGSPALDQLAAELDAIFADIARQATTP